jgi:hypothetical protein
MSANGSKERRNAGRSGTHAVRRRSEDQWRRFLRRTKERWHRLLAFEPFWILLFLTVLTWSLGPDRTQWDTARLEPGAIAPRDFAAPRDALVPDRPATEERQERARQEVLPVYDLDPAAGSRLQDAISRVFRMGRQLTSEDEEGPSAEDLTPALREATKLSIEPEVVRVMQRQELSSSLEDRLRGLVAQVLEQGVVAGKTVLLENRSLGIQLRDLEQGTEARQLDLYGYLDYPDDVRDAVATELRAWNDLSTADREVMRDFLVANLSPNLHLNQRETLRRQEAAAGGVEPVYIGIRQGQVIVRQGDQIDERTASILQALAPEGDLSSRILPVLGLFLFAGLIVLVLWMGIRKEQGENRRPTLLGETLLLLLLALLGSKLCALLADGLAASLLTAPFRTAANYYYAIPFAGLSLVAVLLYGRGLALLLALSMSVMAPIVVEDPSRTMIVYCLVGSLAAILTVDHYHFKQRSLLMRAGAMVGLVNGVAVLMFYALDSSGEPGAPVEGSLWLPLVCALAGGVLVAGVTSFVVPVLESLFSVTTGIKLVELANTNLPLLRRLAFEAPGTFQHSLMVANLSKAGCEAIEADSVLAYTGALYHDVGKIFRPEYFVENQRPGRNRHDKLQPSMSTLILISHVKEGLELAREYHLPDPILHAIAEHHGTRLITYFYKRAQEMQDPESGEVSEEKYRYPGPKPRNKVMGVLMLADGIEAASRSLSDPSPARLRAVIEAITDDCLRDGQLDETDLTLGDLRRVAEAFQRVLTHIHHRRLDYPGFDFNQKGRSRGGEQDSGVLRPLEEPGSEEEASPSHPEVGAAR